MRIGLQAGSSCCVNFEYLGRLDFEDPAGAELDDAVLEGIAEQKKKKKKKGEIFCVEEEDGE